ncbi:MAG: hypothetical protein WD512_16835 [Candidatus Paceibacterota bacterium]
MKKPRIVTENIKLTPKEFEQMWGFSKEHLKEGLTLLESMTEDIPEKPVKNELIVEDFKEMITTNSKLRKEIEQCLNIHSAENGSDTPDFILAQYLTNCLWAFDEAVKQRRDWYGNTNRNK